jgi:hypothetical protein
MKKQVLLSAGILVSGLLGAQVTKRASKIPAHLTTLSATKYPKGMEPVQTSVPSTGGQVTTPNKVKKTAAITSNVIGKTFYDLQSNSSVGDRIVVNADGSIAAVWTMSDAGDPYTNRGTGYAYFNGTAWSAIPTTRVENTRVGWGNIVNTRTGKELILSHDAATNKLNLASRPTKGTGAWSNNQTAIPTATTPGGNAWPRMVMAGDTVYSLSVTQNSTAVAGAAMYQGLNGAVCFSRSKDAGATWDITNTIPTGLGNTARFMGFGGDAYAIAAKGSTVAVVAGDSGKDLVLSKSTDGGVTWTATTILQFPIAKWNPATTTTDVTGDGVADTLDTNDGTFTVGLDNNNMAYVFYGNARILQVTPQTSGGYSYFPYTDGLNMWKEGMPANVGGTLIAAIEDLWEQGKIYFPTVPSGSFAFGLWNNSLTSYPSVAFDASNTMYLSYSSIVDSLPSLVNDLKLVRHVYVIKSSDGGATWTDPCDIVGSPNGDVYEGMFGSMAKRVDGNVHIVYQRDFGPGNGIPGTTAANPDQSDNAGENEIVYFKFPVSEIGACAVNVGIKEQSSMVSGLKFYPNPASTNGTIEISLNDNSKMEISVLNAIGQVVYSTSVAGTAGNNKIDLNLNSLTNGIYFYQVKAGNSKTITNKFVIAK